MKAIPRIAALTPADLPAQIAIDLVPENDADKMILELIYSLRLEVRNLSAFDPDDDPPSTTLYFDEVQKALAQS
jgi:hypothetical protein